MEFLGIGPLELAFILLIVLLVVGPRDVTKTARGLGRAIRSITRSEMWQTVTLASRELRTLPHRLAREAELEELQKAREEAMVGMDVHADTSLAAWTKNGNQEPSPSAPPAGDPATPSADPPARAEGDGAP